jgi:hypothetical protein
MKKVKITPKQISWINTIWLTLLNIILSYFVFTTLFTSKCAAQSLSERINNYEYVADNGQILYGLEAYYRYADDRDLGFKVFAASMIGVTTYVWIAPQKGSCKLSWWERRKARRAFRKRRR